MPGTIVPIVVVVVSLLIVGVLGYVLDRSA